MNISHQMKAEDSGLMRTTIEIAKFEEVLGHKVVIKEPSNDKILYGDDIVPDVHVIHSQLSFRDYHDGKPKIMVMHGEPLSSVGNGVSMKAIVDLAPQIDAFIAFRTEEVPIWQSIKRTWYVKKGIDLDRYKPLDGVKKLAGDPAVLYLEHWRGQRNPLYLCIAMQDVWKNYPKARLHLYNCDAGKMRDTFRALIHHNKWDHTFLRSIITGKVEDVNVLYNQADIIVSCLFPLYARSIEAFGAGKGFVSAGYKENDYPYQCDYTPASIAEAIKKLWSEWGTFDFRAYAEKHHNGLESARQCVEIYRRYIQGGID